MGVYLFFLTSATNLHFFLGVFLHFITGADTDTDGTYTLNPATRMFTTEVLNNAAELDKTIKCNSVRIDEKASAATNSKGVQVNGAAVDNNTARAYGNDNSVFIVVEAEEKVSKSTNYVINDVTGVYTGVQNAEIEVNTAGKTSSTVVSGTELVDQIYTLYNKNNYIIASVILGEAKGSNANYAFILTAGTSEELLADGTHQWEFDAVVDGKITTLTARSKFSKTVMGLEPGHVQELRYNGDYVVGVKTPDDATKYYTDPTSGKINKMDIYDVGHVAYDDAKAADALFQGAPDCAVNSGSHKPTGVTSDRITTDMANDLRVVGRTMYLKPEGTKGDYGLTFVENAPAVVIQKTDGSTKKIPCASVSEAIGLLGDPITGTSKKEFQGRIVAVLNSQDVAEWVVFISDTPVNSAGVSIGGGGAVIDNDIVNAGGGAFTVKYHDPKNDMTREQVRALMISKMEAYTGMKVKSYDDAVTGKMTFDDGSTFGAVATITQAPQVAIKLDGTVIAYTAKNTAVTAANAKALINGSKVQMPDGTYLINDYAASAAEITVSSTGTSFDAGIPQPDTLKDVEIYTAYAVTHASITAKYTDAAGNEATHTTAHFAKKGLVLNLTGANGDNTYRYFTDGTWKSGSEKIAAGSNLTATYTVSGTATITEPKGLMVRVDGNDVGVVETTGPNNTIDITAYSMANVKFVAENNTKTDDHYTTVTSDVAAGFGKYTYTYAAANDDNNDGIIDLIPVVTVTLGANTKGDYSYGSTPTNAAQLNGSATPTTVYMKVGTTLTVTGTTVATGNSIKLGGTNMTGTGCSASTGTVGAKGVYTIQATDLGKTLAFTEGTT